MTCRINMGSIIIFALLLPLYTYAQSIPTLSKCDKDSTPVFLLQQNSTNAAEIKTLPVNNFLDCSEYCANSNDCIGVEYSDKECRILGKSSTSYITNYESGKLVTKNCVKSSKVCSSPFHFEVHEQKILVGFAREVVPAKSLEVCLSACLNSFDTFGFECESIMYYPVDEECILNTEDRLDRPDLFVDENEDTVIYMDNNCAGSQCYAPYITQYIAVEGKQLTNELDREFVDVDLESCEELCTQRLTTTTNDFNCKSFMYNNETRTCILSDERSVPLGRGELKDARGFTYFEKKCFASPRTCRNVPSFIRVPQKILVGFAAFVMENVPSVTMCLDQCTNPPPETGENFSCKSVMYYYNEQECILNAETRYSKPELFIDEGPEFQVDYFDITCHLESEKCTNNKKLSLIKTLNSALPEGDGSLHVLESSGKTPKECLKKCSETKPEKCRSFNYDKEGKLCNLLYLDGKTTLRPVVKKGIDLYDMHCLSKPDKCPLSKNDAIYSRYLYTKQLGLSTKEYPTTSLTKCLELCTKAERCEGVNYNRRNGNCNIYESIDIKTIEKDDHIDFYINLCQVKEQDTGVSASSNVPEKVFKETTKSSKNKIEKTKYGNKNEKDTRIDDLGEKKLEKPTIKEKEPRRKPESSPVNSGNAEGNTGATLSLTNNGQMPAPVLIATDAVQTVCNYEGIKVQIKNNEPFTGVIFVKNRYDTCRVEVQNSKDATLVLGLPHNFGMKPVILNADDSKENNNVNLDIESSKSSENQTIEHDNLSTNEIRRRREAERECGIIDMDDGKYKTTVVVQTNNLGIPGLVTSMDQLYEITCDYSSMLGGKVQAAANLTVNGPEPALIQPRGKIELGNPVLMQMNAADGNSGSVLQAKLGDILELKWEIMAMDEELDFFVKDCFAESGGNDRRADERLQLIEGGCPTPAVSQKLIQEPIKQQSSAVKIAHLQAFRFDSSSTVRITCELEICKGNCQSVQCTLKDGQQESWGRKKRSENSVTEIETRRYKVPRFAQATTSLVIVDPLQQLSEPSPPVAMSRHEQFDFNLDVPITVEKSTTHNGEMCMNKYTLIGIMGTLFALIIVQSTVVLSYIVKRISQNKMDKYSA